MTLVPAQLPHQGALVGKAAGGVLRIDQLAVYPDIEDAAAPLDEAGFAKRDIREAARRIGLPVWDKPALACLSSRFPYGTTITPERLSQVAACERVLREHGFSICRVRYFDERARIEVAPEEVARFGDATLLADVTARFRAAGFDAVEVDPAGYRQGAMNELAHNRA